MEGRRLIWTSALAPGYRPVPVPEGEFAMTVVLDSEAARKQHEAMGFAQGWGAALDQLVALVKGR